MTTVSTPQQRKKFDFLCYIGRFQPFHNGHAAIVEQALEDARYVIMVLGSANQPRTVKNPWTAQERMVMIQRALSPEQRERVFFVEVRDQLYNDQKWVADVQRAVEALVAATEPSGQVNQRIAIIGHIKDDSSFYLKMFPQWGLLEAGNVDGLHSTAIREAYFSPEQDVIAAASLPSSVADYLTEFKASKLYEQLRKEYVFIRDYKAAWKDAPYPPYFVTVDAVVVHSGHVLMVRRRAEPGKGLWALPGGFVDVNERIRKAVIRELKEETRIKIPEPVLNGSIKDSAVFDHPDRSARGRTITHAFYFEFPYGELPVVKGADDADKAKWIPLSKLFEMEPMIFEDHLHIVSFFLGGH